MCQEFSPTPICIILQSLTENFTCIAYLLNILQYFAELHNLLIFGSSEWVYMSKFFHLLICLSNHLITLNSMSFPFVKNCLLLLISVSLNCNLKEHARSSCACMLGSIPVFCIRLAINIF